MVNQDKFLNIQTRIPKLRKKQQMILKVVDLQENLLILKEKTVILKVKNQENLLILKELTVIQKEKNHSIQAKKMKNQQNPIKEEKNFNINNIVIIIMNKY